MSEEMPQTDPVIPPIESSPEFQDRATAALGGPPSNPEIFRPIARPSAEPATPAVPKTAQAARPHDPAFDGPSSELLQARALVGSLVPRLSKLRAVLSDVAMAKAIVDEIKASPLAKSETDLQGIDLTSVTKFLNLLERAQAKD